MKTINNPRKWLRRFSAVIFDFDGVIVDSEVLQARAWEQLARELGHDGLHVTAAQIAGRLDSQIARELFGAEMDTAFCLQRKVALQEELEAQGELQFVPGVLELLPVLHRTHTLAICSNSYEDRVEAFLKQHNLLHWFRAVVGYRDGLAPKPSPQPYVRTLQRLGMGADAACAIEDSPPGIEAAKQAGLFAIQLVQEGIEPSPLADVHITDLAHLRQDEGVI